MHISRRLFTTGATALALTPRPLLAQSGVLTLIVPFAPGGPTDVIGRIIADGLTRQLGQRIVVENVAGAGGATGILRAARAPADGRTLVIGNLGTHGAAPSVTPNLPYDPLKDFEPVGMIAATPIVLVVRKDFPAMDLSSFANLMRNRPGTFSYGHAGQGVTSHTAALLLMSALDAMQVGVTYRGTAPALNDLLAGVIDFAVDQSVIMVEQVRSGAIKALAVAGDRRLMSLPSLRSAAEQGFPNFSITAWNAIYAPKGTDTHLLADLNEGLARTLDEPETAARLASFDAIVPEAGAARSAQALAGHTASEIERWRRIIRL